MTGLHLLGIVALGIAAVAAAHQVIKWSVITWRRAGHCDHGDCVRYWFKNHRYSIWCRRCARFIAKGRDKTHAYPRGRVDIAAPSP